MSGFLHCRRRTHHGREYGCVAGKDRHSEFSRENHVFKWKLYKTVKKDVCNKSRERERKGLRIENQLIHNGGQISADKCVEDSNSDVVTHSFDFIVV